MAIKLTKRQAETLQTAIDDFDSSKDRLLELLQAILDEWTTEIDERSERWQQSAAGVTATKRRDLVQEWIDAIEDVTVPDIEAISD